MLVSVVMPAFNAEKYIAEAIDSVLRQSYEDWELIIIDDGSTDSTIEEIRRAARTDNRVVLFHNSENRGVAESRNVGLENAKGEFIAFLDADDLWFPDKLKVQVDTFINDPNASIVYTSYNRIDSQERVIGFSEAPGIVNYAKLLRSNFICNSSAMLKVDCLNGVRFKCIGHEDYLFWLSIMKASNDSFGIGLKSAQVFYRVHDSSISSNKLKSVLWHWNILRNEVGMSLPDALLNFIFYVLNAVNKRI